MPRLLQIVQLGHPVLRTPASSVPDVHAADVQDLIDDMLATLADVGGVGLAAPQVYVPLRLFIASSRPSSFYDSAPDIAPLVMVNPQILEADDRLEKNWEGCLSIPQLRGLVPRHASVKVRFTTRDGDVAEQEFDDLMARVIQHEYDHLEGVVFLDRLDSTRDLSSERELGKLLELTTRPE